MSFSVPLAIWLSEIPAAYAVVLFASMKRAADPVTAAALSLLIPFLIVIFTLV